MSLVLSGLLLAVFPPKSLAFLANNNSALRQRTGSSITRFSLLASSPISQANEALQQLDVQSAEAFLMKAVAEVNGAVMTNPPLLRCFEDLFRTKIKINTAQEKGGESVAYAVAQDRMGLASLLTDQSKYQEAANELELAVRSLSVLASSSEGSAIVSALDNASSLLFRTRAMVCDWEYYNQSCQDLSESTQSALVGGALPSVHPFEALAWPCLSLRDATCIAHEYGKRAMKTSIGQAQAQANLPWTNLEDRLPRKNVPFVRAITTSLRAENSNSNSNSNPSQTTDSNQRVIKVGYLSPDFTGRHPLAFLMQDVFRFHDTSRFEIIMYSLGGDPDGSPEVERIIHGRSSDVISHSWKTLKGSIETMAQTVSEDNLDVVIDLCGYTGTSLVAEVMACLRSLEEKAALRKPVHVAYMGFPGSSGAPYIDYMIADAVVIPSKFRPWYTENILFMPHCYFVNSHWHIKNAKKSEDNKHQKQQPLERNHYELPAAPAFVFCCHSRPDKIDPSTFCTWVRALKRTRTEGRAAENPGMTHAVLWLLRSPGAPQMEGNLQRIAQSIFGDDENDNIQNAIVFCDQAPRDEHLERLALADLYLDTPAYNAHTVGCDCLSAGVPMISLLLPWHQPSKNNSDMNFGSAANNEAKVPTEKLASRVGASLLKSAGTSSLLTDTLVVASMEEYEDQMVECASSSSFASIKQHLLDDFSTAPLWDTERWVRNLETGLATMVDLQTKESCETDIYVMDYSDIKTTNQKS